jgi:hypothetical protein
MFVLWFVFFFFVFVHPFCMNATSVSSSGAFIDMGKLLPSSRHKYKLLIRNCSNQTVNLLLSVSEISSIRADYRCVLFVFVVAV